MYINGRSTVLCMYCSLEPAFAHYVMIDDHIPVITCKIRYDIRKHHIFASKSSSLGL